MSTANLYTLSSRFMPTPGDTDHDQTYECKYGRTVLLRDYTNYYQWSLGLKGLLLAVGAFNLTLGKEKPPATKEALQKYRRSEGRAAALIYFSCHSSVRPFIAKMDDPRAMWVELKRMFDQSTTEIGQSFILQDFLRTQVDSSGIACFIAKLTSLRTQLDGTPKAISDELYISYILRNLPSSAETIRCIIEDQPDEIKTINYVIRTLITWENSIKSEEAGVSSSTNGSSTMNSSNALTTKTSPLYSGNRVNKRSPSEDRPIEGLCWYCCRLGHKRNDCRMRKRAAAAAIRRKVMRGKSLGKKRRG